MKPRLRLYLAVALSLVGLVAYGNGTAQGQFCECGTCSYQYSYNNRWIDAHVGFGGEIWHTDFWSATTDVYWSSCGYTIERCQQVTLNETWYDWGSTAAERDQACQYWGCEGNSNCRGCEGICQP